MLCCDSVAPTTDESFAALSQPSPPKSGPSKSRDSGTDAIRLMAEWGDERQRRQQTLSTLHWDCGSCSRRGSREQNDDRSVVINDFEELIEKLKADKAGNGYEGLESGEVDIDESGEILRAGRIARSKGGGSVGDIAHSFFAIYDGHGGCNAAQYLACNLHFMIALHPDFRYDLNTALHDSCLLADENFLDMCAGDGNRSGTTALGAFLRGNKLTIFNVGDCMAVLKRADKAVGFIVQLKCVELYG